jgi:hypothetical protein
MGMGKSRAPHQQPRAAAIYSAVFNLVIILLIIALL